MLKPVCLAVIVVLSSIESFGSEDVTVRSPGEDIGRWLVEDRVGIQNLVASGDGSEVLFRNGGLGAEHELACYALQPDEKIARRKWSIPGAGCGWFHSDGDKVVAHLTKERQWQVYSRSGKFVRNVGRGRGPIWVNQSSVGGFLVGSAFDGNDKESLPDLPRLFQVNPTKTDIRWGPEGFEPSIDIVGQRIFFITIDAHGKKENRCDLRSIGYDFSGMELIKHFDPAVARPSISPDGKLLIAVQLAGGTPTGNSIVLFDLTSGAVTKVSRDDHASTEPKFSPQRESRLFCYRELRDERSKAAGKDGQQQNSGGTLVLADTVGRKVVLSTQLPEISESFDWALTAGHLLWSEQQSSPNQGTWLVRWNCHDISKYPASALQKAQ